MNILILSCGTRNKIVQYFKRSINNVGKIYAADCSELAPALYDADGYFVVPRITETGYIDCILSICQKQEISAVFSLIDPELSLLAENEDRFLEAGVKVIGSSYEICERCLNKMKMYEWLDANGYSCAKSYTDKNKFYNDLNNGSISFPVFVKPVCGSASIAISKVYDKETVELLFKHNSGLMIQEYLNGQEIGADCYIDMISGEVVSIFTKKKLVMRAGETDKAVSFKDPKLFELIKRFCNDSSFRGQIDIDIFEIAGDYYISEVNPRFGGGYPHAYECGADHMKLIINNVEGKVNESTIGDYRENVYMMKYNEVKII